MLILITAMVLLIVIFIYLAAGIKNRQTGDDQ